jgi:hypothetical protein
VRRAQLLARVDAAVLAAQPLTVEQMAAGELGADADPAQPRDRLTVAPVGDLALTEQRLDAGVDPRAHWEDVTRVRSDSHPSAALTSARSPVRDAASAQLQKRLGHQLARICVLALWSVKDPPGGPNQSKGAGRCALRSVSG